MHNDYQKKKFETLTLIKSDADALGKPIYYTIQDFSDTLCIIWRTSWYFLNNCSAIIFWCIFYLLNFIDLKFWLRSLTARGFFFICHPIFMNTLFTYNATKISNIHNKKQIDILNTIIKTKLEHLNLQR